MKTTCYFLFIVSILVVAFMSCNNKNETIKSNCESIEIDISKTNTNPATAFSKIKITPLQTNDTVLLNRIKTVNLFANKYFVVIDKDLIVHIFDSNGQFISNSAKKSGPGPEEYYTINDAIYNQFTDKFELLGYNNSEIITYDKYFNFIRRVKVKTKEKFHFSSFIALNNDEYALTPSLHESTDKIVVYNVKNDHSETLTVEGNIAKLTMTETPFKYSAGNNTFYFTPVSINNSVFNIHAAKKRLERIIDIRVLKNPINETKLKNFNTDNEVADFLFNNSSYVLPLRTMVSEKYMVSIIMKDKELFTFSHNRETDISYVTKNKYRAEQSLPLFFTLEDNILYSLVNSFDVKMHVDMDLLDESDIEVLEKIEEDSNPVIVKYILK